MKRVAAAAHFPTPRLFKPAKNAQTIEPTTAYTALSSPSASTIPYNSRVEWDAPCGRADSGEVSVQ